MMTRKAHRTNNMCTLTHQHQPHNPLGARSDQKEQSPVHLLAFASMMLHITRMRARCTQCSSSLAPSLLLFSRHATAKANDFDPSIREVHPLPSQSKLLASHGQQRETPSSHGVPASTRSNNDPTTLRATIAMERGRAHKRTRAHRLCKRMRIAQRACPCFHNAPPIVQRKGSKG